MASNHHLWSIAMNREAEKGTALITGASTGIGAVYAERLARRGYDLILVARNAERLEALAARIETDTLSMVETLPVDLNDPAGLHRVEAVLRNDTSINMLVNNAGMGIYAPTLTSDLERMDDMVGLNVTAVMRLAYVAARSFVERDAGAIINLSSAVALAPEMLNGVYCGTKAFVLAFSQALRHELSETGVRVQVVLPGAIATEFWANAGKSVDQLPQQSVMSAEDLVDAALNGFDQGEFVTIPSLPDMDDWLTLEAARMALRPLLSLSRPARRYSPSKQAAA
jgi:uncharacterized protein